MLRSLSVLQNYSFFFLLHSIALCNLVFNSIFKCFHFFLFLLLNNIRMLTIREQHIWSTHTAHGHLYIAIFWTNQKIFIYIFYLFNKLNFYSNFLINYYLKKWVIWPKTPDFDNSSVIIKFSISKKKRKTFIGHFYHWTWPYSGKVCLPCKKTLF